MNKKFLSAILFGALMVTSTGTFVSCKDYDDDIENLQSQLGKKASVEELQSQLSALQSSLADAKAAAAEAKAAAEAAKTAAEKAGDDAAAAAAAMEIAAAEAKEAAIAAAEEKIAALQEEVKNSMDASLEEIKAIATKVDEASALIMSITGHRLTSLSVIPTTHVNGIAAITLTTLKYDPQVYTTRAPGNHTDGPSAHEVLPFLDHKDNGANPVYISTEKNEAYFHVSPNVGVRTQDITLPSFDCIQSENTARGVNVTVNSPVMPTAYSIDKNVLTVNFKKTITGPLNPAAYAHETVTGKEEFYMASLKAPIAEANWTETEKEIGEPVYVNSEYVRLEENIKAPYLANSRTQFGKPFPGNFADEVQTDADGEFYVHYHDSLCVYQSIVNELVDVVAPYNKTLDLKKLVTVCVTEGDNEHGNNNSHSIHEDWTAKYKDYGLAFRFYLAKAAYITQGGEDHNTNRTDQQKFAEIDSPENGLMTSRVYTIDGNSATAVGREPIVRVELRDTVNNNLVAQRYIKIKWAKTVGTKELSTEFADSIYVCGNYYGRVGTQQMNEDIYDKMKEGGMTKKEFHNIYKDTGFSNGEGDGVVELKINDQDDVESYNFIWVLTHKDIVTKYPNWNAQEKMEFTKVCTWKDASNANETLRITLKRTIYKPVFGLWGYDGRYWKNDGKYETFNVNPVVYGAKDWNPGWGEWLPGDGTDHKNAPTCNIYTDLLNGFLDHTGKKPTTGADGILWFQDNGNETWAGKKLYYAIAPRNPATDTYVAYAKEGVRFVFDAAKLEAADTKYVYNYYNGTAVVKKTAEVRNFGTELWINNELAATIHNYRKNLCTDSENTTVGDMTYQIVLEEEKWDHAPYSGDIPTDAAKAIVGQLVPIKLMVDLCYDDGVAVQMEKAHTALIKEYEAFIIDPLTIAHGETEDFTDATVGGSTIDVKGAFVYTCWNADENGNKYTAYKNGTALQKALYNFYECKEGEWLTKQVTTNLKMDADGNLVPTEGVTDGPLPATTTVTYNSADETLTYHNHSGTPVNRDYIMYIPVEFGYKWKTFSETFVVKVSKNAGTPAE